MIANCIWFVKIFFSKGVSMATRLPTRKRGKGKNNL
jgi:hypothetical protein